MRWADSGVPVKLLAPEALAIMLGHMGIDKTTTVIIYTEQSDYKAPYLVWALDYIRHPSAAILEGGFGKWQKEGCPTTQDYPKITPTSYLLPSILHQEVRATLEEVKEVVRKGGHGSIRRPTDGTVYRGEGSLEAEGPHPRRAPSFLGGRSQRRWHLEEQGGFEKGV